MRMSKLLRSILKTAVYVIDQTSEQFDRASERASDFADDAREAIYPSTNHALRNILAFAAGVGVGVGAGMLLAPSSGAELRSSIGEKVQDISARVKGRSETYPTGTDMR